MGDRLILFFHIPKCGGQSTNLMIDHGIRCRSHDYFAPTSLLWDLFEDPVSFCERALRADFVSGHLTLDMVDYIRSRVPTYVFTVLRRPPARLRSNIRYLWQHNLGPAEGLSHLPFDEVVRIAHAERRGSWARPLANACTRMLSGSVSPEFFVGGDGRRFVDRALLTLSSFDHVGDVAALEKTIATVLEDNRSPVPSEIAHANVSVADTAATDSLTGIADRFADCLHMDEMVWRGVHGGEPITA